MPDAWTSKASRLHQQIAENFFTLFIGVEGEFYVSHEVPEAEFQNISQALLTNDTLKIISENGLRQFEYHIQPSAYIDTLITQTEEAMATIAHITNHHAILTSKPYTDQPSSGLHIHLHAEDASGKRLFYKHEEDMSETLEHSIAGLLHHLPEAAALLIFDGGSERYARPEDHVPTTVSWGTNNRSCAIRLPDTAPDQKRIEYRIAPADAPLPKLLAIIFASVLDGLKHQYQLPVATHGNASDAQYHLEKLPTNIAEAERILTRHFRLRHMLS